MEAIARVGASASGRIIDDTDLSDERLFAGVIELLRSGRLPDALVCASDAIAFALIDLLHAEGLEVPRDVIVTGFDGILATRLSTPTLTTVRQPMEMMGRVAAHLLISDGISDGTSDGTGFAASEFDGDTPATRTVRLGTQLQLGGSCGCPS
jgi:LacI family transcriptional regulator